MSGNKYAFVVVKGCDVFNHGINYAVNDEKNNSLYKKYEELAKKEENVIFGGRLGQYRYFDMDDTIDEALKLADRIL